MKILFINETCGIMSHGRICCETARKFQQEGHTCKIAYGRSSQVPDDSKDLAVRIGNTASVYSHVLYTRLFDRHGFGSYFATKDFLRWMDSYCPDMIWLHNIHGYYIHIGLLFDWIKKHPEIVVRWMLHDCWAFTGHCSHYMAVNCNKWKSGCSHCPEKKQYPASVGVDNCKKNYRDKKRLFTGVSNMRLVVPSQWLADQLKDSFLNEYSVSVEHNQIDHSVFRPISDETLDMITVLKTIREKYLIPYDKTIILGVASKWTQRKGWEDYLKLDTQLNHHKQVLILVGVDKRRMNQVPSTIIGIQRTENREELACLYSIADVFVNLTYEDNYPTVNLEAEACNTDVLTYDSGGCKETLSRNSSKVYPVGRLDLVLEEIKNRTDSKENGMVVRENTVK